MIVHNPATLVKVNDHLGVSYMIGIPKTMLLSVKEIYALLNRLTILIVFHLDLMKQLYLLT